MKSKILISTGGSGGHVLPAITIYDHLKSNYETLISTDLRGLKYLDKENYNGALIIYVVPGSPAAKEGLKSEDIIISINQKEIRNPKDVIDAISKNGIKDKMKFKILRGNKIFYVSITPDDLDNLKIANW